MSLSQLALEIKESVTLALNSKARILKEAGQPVIHLGSGEPKSKVPFEAILAAASKLATGEIRYTATAGIPSLIKAVINYTEKNYGKKVGKENVIISSGAKQAIYNLMMTLLDPEDEVILIAPYWVSYPEIVKMLRGVPVVVEPEAGQPEPNIDDIAKAVTPKTRAIMVNTPNNPSGAVYSRDLIKALVEYCEKNQIYVIMDDIYHQLVFDGQVAVSPYEFANDDIDKSYVIIVNGVSKAYAMTGFRIGWTIANSKVTRITINVAAQNTSCPAVVPQEAAVGALNGDQTGVEVMRRTLQKNRDIMMRELASIDGLKVTPPQGTFYCLPDFSKFNNDSGALSQFLLDKALVVTVPGIEFGLEGYLRLSYCGAEEDIINGVARIRWALDPSAPKEIQIGDRTAVRDW